MNLAVKHNGTTITGRVISYTREHRICTGIGTLELVLEGTYATSISPHHTIDIWENGSFQVRYYVSDVAHNVPSGTITIQCQDKSKYLVDYFIPTSYTIDYPSYTRYWIELFLDEMGVQYIFNTTSQGNLLSNYTQLGLQSGYDQIMMLLQLSGWYMYFDGNGKAVIGPLATNLATSAGSLGKTDILDIKKVTDDKMLRNRAVVWGEYDGFTGQYAFADVSVHTRENYDHNDLRAMVISNSNIPNKNSAYGIANQLLKEFARPTIEKHIVAWGARNFNLGEALKVDSHIWRGKGLITTFGVSMDKSGLVTNIVLDERCPRLFGFFNFGDYVYVATYGEGIWRKHIKFDPTWYNFSTGLTDLSITDLHIKDGIFGAVGASGVPFYNHDESGSWHPITITGLDSSIEDTASGIIAYQSFSGIMARATIIDKETNNIKFGVDTYSGLNLGDYFLNYSGMTTSASGVSISGGHRGWIVECDPFTGQLVGGLGSGVYPISVSGSYDIRVLDLENDGHNDYVSVSTGGGSIIPFLNGKFNYGSALISVTSLNDDNSYVGMATTDSYDLEGETLNTTPNVGILQVIDNEVNDERDIIGVGTGPVFKRTRFTIAFDITLGRDKVSVGAVTSSTQAGLGSLIATQKVSTDVYRFYQATASSDANNLYTLFEYREWNAATNTAGSDITIGTLTVPKDLAKTINITQLIDSKSLVLGGKIWYYVESMGTSTNSTTNPTNYIKFYLMKIDLLTSTIEFNGLIGDINFNTRNATENWIIADLNSSFPHANWLLRNGDYPSIAIFIREFKTALDTYQENWLVHSDFGTDFETVSVQSNVNPSDPSFLQSGNTKEASQLTRTGRILYHRRTSDGLSYIYNGTSVTITTLASIPIQYQNSKIITIVGKNDNHYIVHDGSNWYFATPFSLLLGDQITFPAQYTIIRDVFRTTSSLSEMYFWRCKNGTTNKEEIVRMTTAGFYSSIVPFSSPGSTFTSGFIIGNIFTNGTNALYVNNANEIPSGTRYLVLQREGSDFTIIEEEAYPIRIDISNNSPLLDVGSGDASFVSNYIYDTELLAISPAAFGGGQVNDYRYTYLEPVASGVTVSGVAGLSTGLYVTSSGVYGFDVASYSGGFMLYYNIPSGAGTRIETSNYGLNGQYIFITTSGGIQEFYQKDPDGFGFTLYSGLVQSRATIIRCDDRL